MDLRIAHTGIRSGETIECSSSGTQCKGTVIKIRGNYPPLQSWVDNLTLEQVRDQFNNFRFFSSMTPEQRLTWLKSHANTHKDLYMEDVDGLYIKFINIGGKFMLEALGPEQVNLLLAGNPRDPEGYWDIRDVYDMFPRKPNSRAKKHTLIFRPNNWTLLKDGATVSDIYEGLAVHLELGTLLYGQFDRKDYTGMYIIESPDELKQYTNQLAIISNTSGTAELTYDHLEQLCGEMGYDVRTMRQIYNLIEWFSPSPHKSLIQKILRTRCTHVEYVGVEYPANLVLITSFIMLMAHAGAFVPNLQKFVSGMESALKRLAVAICEDAWIGDGSKLTSLLAGAWVAQTTEKGHWIPSDALLKLWISYAVEALDSPYLFDYNWHEITTPVFAEWTSWYMNYYLLANLKSFDSDIKMLASIALRNGQHTGFEDIRIKRKMPLYHCIDQHSFTDIAHYVPYETVKELGSYNELFKQIWQKVVGINPRKPEYKGFDFMDNKDPFFNKIRNAQMMIWISRMYTPQPLPVTGDISQIEYTCNSGWLSSFVSVHEVKIGHTTALVMMNPDDVFEYTAVKRPSRDDKTPPELTEEEKMRAVDHFKNMLRNGLKFTGVPSTLAPFFQGGILYLVKDDTDYLIKIGNDVIPWEQALQLNIQVPVHAQDPGGNYLYNALTRTGDGVRENADTLFQDYLNKLPIAILQRAMIYLTYDKEIDLFHISRDGGGTEMSVSIDDTGVNYLLGVICSLYPGALMKNGSKFLVKTGPLMWKLSMLIAERIKQLVIPSHNTWSNPLEEKRQLWPHQIEAIENLLQSNGKKKIQIIYVEPGLGKTAIACNFIRALILNQTMPQYCLYTLPVSAIPTIEKEFALMQIPYCHVDMRKTSKTPKEIKPGCVTLIYHDHLRMLDLEFVKQIMPHTLFIVDECHKTLNPTKRTSVAQELSFLANFTVCMTGTLITNNNIELIINWLKMAVNFEVNTDNYWIALNSIFSRKIQTKIIVDRIVLEAPMNDDEKRRYYAVVPQSLGGTASKINFKAASDISYEPVTREIINMIMFHLEHGEKGVFVAARNESHQYEIENMLKARGINDIFLIGRGKTISLTPANDIQGYVPRVCITTMHHVEGYEMTLYRIFITGVYFSNEASRYQVEHRIIRLSQTSPTVRILILHSGILTYIHRQYQKTRNFALAIKGFAKDASIDPNDIDY